MTLKDIITEETKKIEHKDIPISQLDSMLDYQRDIDMGFIQRISQDGVFDEKEVDEVKVSVRADGSFKVCDGQHTIAILKRRGWLMAPCELRHGLTTQEENDWFTITNTKERAQSRKRILTSQMNGTYEKNKIEQDFNACVKGHGLRLDIYGETPGYTGKIGCPAKLLAVYKDYLSKDKLEKFNECLDIVHSCFKGEPASLQWSFLRGMFDFYEAYDKDFERKRLVEALSRENIRDIKKDAEADIRTKKTSKKYAKLFVEKYNYKLPKKRWLRMSQLDD